MRLATLTDNLISITKGHKSFQNRHMQVFINVSKSLLGQIGTELLVLITQSLHIVSNCSRFMYYNLQKIKIRLKSKYISIYSPQTISSVHALILSPTLNGRFVPTCGRSVLTSVLTFWLNIGTNDSRMRLLNVGLIARRFGFQKCTGAVNKLAVPPKNRYTYGLPRQSGDV